MKIQEVVTIDSDILGGVPVFKGTRVPVKNLFEYLEAGDSLQDFLNDFDYIPKEYCLKILELSEKLLTDSKIYESINWRTIAS